jgi:hypothetical protein
MGLADEAACAGKDRRRKHPALGPTWRPVLETLEDRIAPAGTPTPFYAMLPPAPVVFADFNRDGFLDMAVGNPTATVSGKNNAGAINVYYGSANGFSSEAMQYLDQNNVAGYRQATADHQFGYALTAGDFNGDGYFDLAIGVPYGNVGSTSRAGFVLIVFGSAAGLDSATTVEWNSNVPGTPHNASKNDQYGFSLGAGDFNGDGYGDLAVGAINNTPADPATGQDYFGGGDVFVLYGSATGIIAKGSHALEMTNGLKGRQQSYQHLGFAIAVGDFNGDGYADIALSSPDYNAGDDQSVVSAGVVNVVYGGPTGIKYTNGNQLFAKFGSNIFNAIEVGTDLAAAGDRFGYSLAARDFNGDGYTDLAIGIPGNSVNDQAGAGAVLVLYGGQTANKRLGAESAQFFTQDNLGNGGAAQATAAFGGSLGAGDFNGDGYFDLAIGAPNQAVDTLSKAGAINVLYGPLPRLSETGSQFWTPTTINNGRPAQANAQFGAGLAGGHVLGNTADELAIASPGMTIGTVTKLGATHLMAGSFTGLSNVGNQFLYPGPAMPTKLVGVAQSTTSIELRWKINASDATGYEIQRSVNGVNWSPLTTVASTVTTYRDNGLLPNTTYYYRVCAVNTAGGSGWAKTATAPGLPAAPSNLAALVTAVNQVTLTWKDNANNEGGFTIFRSMDGVNYTSIATVSTNNTFYVDAAATSGTLYYQVQAFNAVGRSALSDPVAITVAPPAAPSGMTANAVSTSQINLGWIDNASNESGFKLYRSLDKVSWTVIATLGPNVTSYSDTGLAADTQYYYKARAFNGAGNSSYSNTAGSYTGVPAAPGSLAATVQSSSQVKLTWTDNASNESGFIIERSTDGTAFAYLTTVGANVQSFTDTDLTASTTYYYRVKAINAVGDSPDSNIVMTLTATPAAPTSLTATAVSTSRIDLSWSDNSSNETGFKIFRSTDGVNFTLLIKVGPNVTSFSDTGLSLGTTYWYKVRAYNGIGDSPWTNSASATTL